MILSVSSARDFGLLFIAASAIGFYIAGRVGVDALTDLDRPSSIRLALGHWFPIALLAIIACAVGQPIIAICTVLGTCVAALLLTLGLITATTGDSIGVADTARAWLLLLPAALLVFLAGFRAHLTWFHAIVLLLEGLAVAVLWGTPPRPAPADPQSAASTAPRRLTAGRWLEFALALIVAGFSAFLAISGTLHMSNEIPLTTPGLIAAVGLAPLLILPMIGTGTALAERGQGSVAASGLVALSLLNLCLLLPLLVFTAAIRNWYLALAASAIAVPFPMVTWRVDTVFVLIMGAVLAPVALGRWRLGRAEGVILVLAYAAYIGCTSVLAVRW